MRAPFSREQFFAVFADYNQGVWPMQIVLAALAVMIVGLAIRSPARPRWLVVGIALLWAWMAIGYHFLFFARLNRAAAVFGAAFLVQAFLLLWYGLRGNGFRIRVPSEPVARGIGWALISYALVVYPLVGYAVGHRYPAAPTFGLPCPTTIFTFGILAWMRGPLPWAIAVVPILWSVIGTSAAMQLGVPQDFGLPAGALLFLFARLAPRLRRAPIQPEPARG